MFGIRALAQPHKAKIMLLRYVKIAAAIILSLIFTVSLGRLVVSLWNQLNWTHWPRHEWHEVELWLQENQLDEYKELFREKGDVQQFDLFVSEDTKSACRINVCIFTIMLKIPIGPDGCNDSA